MGKRKHAQARNAVLAEDAAENPDKFLILVALQCDL